MRNFVVDSIFLIQFILLCLSSYWLATGYAPLKLGVIMVVLCIASIFVNMLNVQFIEGYTGTFKDDRKN